MNKKIDYQKHINRMSKIAPLSDKEMKILAELHILRDYKKNTVIDKQGSISRAVYYLNQGMG